MRYSAFISYNHSDRAWAVWLHRALERYRVPSRLQGKPTPWGPLGPTLPPVFRDRDELATSSDLAASVKAALAESATLVVICSPNSARSKWVDKEVRTFREQGRGDQIRLIIVDGEPHAAVPDRECLPQSFLEPGATEPLAADVRDEGDGKTGAWLKVLAGIIGVSYDELRQREASRRQKRLAAIAAGSLAGLVVASGLAVFAWLSRNEAIGQRQLAERRTVTAERTLEFVKDMFRVADPSEAKGASITAREIVDRGAASLDLPTLKREPMVRAELGVTLAEVYGTLGLYRQSDALVRRTFAIRQNEPATYARQLAALGESQFRLGEYEAAETTFRRARSQSASGSDALRSRILSDLGQTLFNLEKYDEGERVLRQALAIDRKRGEAGGNDVARDLEAIGLNYFYGGEADKAESLVIQALALRRRYEGDNSPSVSDNLNTLGQISYTRHDLAAAERYFRGNIAIDEKVLGANHPDHATTLNNLARVLIEQRKFGQAVPLLERAIAIAAPEKGEAHPDMAFFYSNLAIARRHDGHLALADHLFGQAIATARKTGHRTLGPSLADLAEVRCAQGRFGEAWALLGEAARVTAKDYPDKVWRKAWVENIQGECLLKARRNGEGARTIAQSSPAIINEWPAATLFASEATRRLRAR